MRLLQSALLLAVSACAATPDAGVATNPAPAPAPADASPPNAPPQSSQAKKFEFETFELVLLMRGPKRIDPPPPGIEALQKAHLAHLTRMGQEGKMVLAGPLGDQRDPSYRGVCLYRVGSQEEARRLAESDPMVKAGWLRAEVMTWYVEKGYVAFPRAPPLQP